MINVDPTWPRASLLLVEPAKAGTEDVGLLGAHTCRTSLSPRSTVSTPLAVREALSHYSTWNYLDQRDLSDGPRVVDYGDVPNPDDDGADWTALTRPHPFWIFLGGDNALTWQTLRRLGDSRLESWGLLTLDAHHDLRDGRSNGSPVRQLLDEGVRGNNIVQVGIADFANSATYARRASEAGVRVVSRHEVRERTLSVVVDEALSDLATRVDRIYVDIDVDVMDRAFVPGCPAAVPGGLTVDEVRGAVRRLAAHPLVAAMDFTEVDVERDTADGRTVRTVALLSLDALAGYQRRTR